MIKLESKESMLEVMLKLMKEIENLRKEVEELKRKEREPFGADAHLDVDADALAEFLSVFSSPERISILKLLFVKERYFGELESLLNLGPSSLRHHLSRLMRFGLISQERSRGKYIITDLGKKVYGFLVRFYREFVRGGGSFV